MTAQPSFRLKAYRAAFRGGLWPTAARLAHGLKESEPERAGTLRALQALGPAAREIPRTWFHAASVGELEGLRPLVDRAVQEGWECVVTCFSPSARGAVRRVAEEGGARVRFAGYSPREGEWESAILSVRPRVFVTAKYEAWPDLWASLGAHGVPLVVLGARPRGALVQAPRWLQVLGAVVPPLELLPFEESDVAPLRLLFSGAAVESCRDPRWDRVIARSKRGSDRARALVDKHASLPRPWGVLGSAWPEDLERFESLRKDFKGTLWVVPHKVDDAEVRRIERALESLGLKGARTTRPADAPDTAKPCVIVDEMGFLSELYSAADWAFVGGGFGDGVHSTIEPAVHGIPVAAGPANAEKFPEVSHLRADGQLTLVHGADELGQWLERARTRDGKPAFDGERFAGGTDAAWRRLQAIVSRRAAW